MYKVLLCTLFYLIAPSTHAAGTEAETPKPLDPKYMGEHGMVIMANVSTLYISLMPQYKESQNAQLVYELDNDNIPLINLARDADLVTVKPKPFNLQHLLRGEELKITADIYMGHYARGGMLIYPNVELTLEKPLYLRLLDSPEESQNKHTYDSIELKNNQRMLIHQIQTAPSYDQIILLLEDVSCMTEFTTDTAVPTIREVYRKLAFCGSMKPLYYETQDFEK